MEQFVLKEILKEKINGRAVKAAVFYSFNFDPRFFENYVMPLFFPDKDFRDEIVHNKILWRSILKESNTTKLTVCCDFFAKDNTTAPSLGYDIYCIKVPAAKGHICNFHPKQIFICLEDGSLLVVTGSGNITPSGWCENYECFSIEEFVKNKQSPNRTNTNLLQEIILRTAKLSGNRRLSDAEVIVYDCLSYIDFEEYYYNSIDESFKDFIEDLVFEGDEITEVEIISPYFSNDHVLVNYLKNDCGVKKIKCLIPTIKSNEIQMSKEAFLSLEKAGVEWCLWKNYRQKDEDRNRNTEVRNLHAKVYRFIGKSRSYTVIGSVNFTNPAWAGYRYRNNTGNVEAAWLYMEPKNDNRLLKPISNINYEHYSFVEKQDLEHSDSMAGTNRDVPEVEFVIDWKTQKLQVKSKDNISNCYFMELAEGQLLKKGTYELSLSPEDIKGLSSNAIIEIEKRGKDESWIYVFYPSQQNIQLKPLDFKLSAINVLQYWEFLDDGDRKEALTRLFAEKSTDESGIVNEDVIENRSFLNEMAAHFNSLVKLEKYIFPQEQLSVKSSREKLKQISYYLLSENIDTIPFYVADLYRQAKAETVQKSFCWMILEIIIMNFYNAAAKWPHRNKIEAKEWKEFRKNLAHQNYLLRNMAIEVGASLGCSDKKLKWVVQQLSSNYE